MMQACMTHMLMLIERLMHVTAIFTLNYQTSGNNKTIQHGISVVLGFFVVA